MNSCARTLACGVLLACIGYAALQDASTVMLTTLEMTEAASLTDGATLEPGNLSISQAAGNGTNTTQSKTDARQVSEAPAQATTAASGPEGEPERGPVDDKKPGNGTGGNPSGAPIIQTHSSTLALVFSFFFFVALTI